MKLAAYICDHCGNIVIKVKDAGVPVVCCGEKMRELVANTTDAATEKHVPVYEIADGKVSVVVGEVEHPMIPEHYIEWICVEKQSGFELRYLKPGDAPKAVFALADGDEVQAVYAYCNLHGLWVK